MKKIKNDATKQDDAMNVLAKYYDKLMAYEGACHLGIGLRVCGGDVSDELCIFVEVEHKKNKNEIDADQLIPEMLDNFYVDVRQISEITPAVLNIDPDTTAYTPYRPMLGGTAVSNQIKDNNNMVSYGTLGAMVLVTPGGNSPDTPFVGILSNQHVLYAKGAENNQSIYQSQINEGVVATNYNSLSGTNPITDMDVAVAKIETGVGFTNSVSLIGNLQGIIEPRVGMKVEKNGITTILSLGTVTDLYVQNPNVNMVVIGMRILAGFPNLEPDTRFAYYGDSGSVAVRNRYVMGLVHSISASKKPPFYTYANSVQYISDTWINLKIPATPTQIIGLRDDKNRLESYAKILSNSSKGREFLTAFMKSSKEVIDLIHHQRECCVAWHRNKIFEFFPIRDVNNKNDPYAIQQKTKNTVLSEALAIMKSLFLKHGSEQLVESIEAYGDNFLKLIKESGDVDELVKKLCSDDKKECV